MLALVLALSCAIAGCHSFDQFCRRDCVSAELSARTGQSLGPVLCQGETAYPPGVDVADGVTEDEAIQIALWNNALFQELLSGLGISSAQLFDAGLLTDPEFVLLFPIGPKQLEFTLYQSVDAVWLRPIRVKAAELDLARVADQMVQNGLNLIRDVRVAHANLLFAQHQDELANEALRIRTQIADLARRRLEAGDISELEANDSHVQSLTAKADAARFAHDVTLASDRLRVLMGLALYDMQLVAIVPPLPDVPERNKTELVTEAFAMRPDLRAAQINAESAAKKAKLARCQFMRLDAAYDANGEGTEGFESGPGLRFTIPLFNANKGAVAIADAQHEQAARQFVTVRDQIALDVGLSYTAARQSAENLATLRTEILPAMKSALDLAEKNYAGGGTPYLMVLQSTSQFLDARARELLLLAELRRAIAELERSVGHRFLTSPNRTDPGSNPPSPAPGEKLDLLTPDAETSRIVSSDDIESLPPCRPVRSIPKQPSRIRPVSVGTPSSDEKTPAANEERPPHGERFSDTGPGPRLLPHWLR